MASNTTLAHIPLNGGQREDIDAKLLPQGLLRRATNLRLRKAGRLGVRKGYTALSTQDVDGNTVRMFDVASHNGVLVGFGTANASASGPEAVYSYEPTRARWRKETAHGSRPRQFSVLSEVEEFFRPSFAKTDEALLYDVAYAGGYVALVYEGDAADSLVYVHIFSATTGALLFETTVAARTHPRVAPAGNVFVFAWQDSSDDVRCATFDPSSATALSAESVIHNAGTVGDGIDLAGVAGASEVVLFVVRSDTGAASLYRLNTSLAVQATGSLTRTDVSLGSVVSASGARTHVAYVRTGGAYELESFTTATLATAEGPTALFGGATGTRPPGLAFKSASTLVISAAIADTYDAQLKVDVRAATGHTASAQYTRREVSQSSKPLVSSDGQFCGVVSPYGKGGLVSFHGVHDLEHGRGYECALNRGYAVDALATWLGSVATDGTYHYAVMVADDLSCSHIPVVVRFRAMSPERRQTATVAGLLLVAGGFVGSFDGDRFVEAGYLDAPVIVSATPSNGAGALTSSSEYSYVAHYEWRDKLGYRHQSQVSDPVQVTLGASDDTVTVVVSTPHSIRRVVSSDASGKVVLSRTKRFPDRTHRRCAQAYGSTAFAATASITDLASDDEISTQEVVYTQGTRGSLSGPLGHDGPFSADYVAATRERALLGGLPVRAQIQESKRVFPAEPVNFSNFPGFFATVGGRVRAVASQDDLDFAFTARRTFVVGGPGPDDNGNGEFSAPRELPGDAVGCDDWRSVVATAKGIWFQDADGRLQLIPRGGGGAEWLGQAVRDTLASYPVITSASVVGADNCVYFTAATTAGDGGVVIVHDLRTGDWFVDDTSDVGGGALRAGCDHEGRFACVGGTTVYLQDAAPDAQANVALEGYVSYDDGVSFAPMGASPFTVSGSAGSTFSVQWWPYRRKGDRFVLRFAAASADAGTLDYTFDSGTICPWGAEGWGKLVSVTLTCEVSPDGLTFTNLTLETQTQRKASRKGSASKR